MLPKHARYQLRYTRITLEIIYYFLFYFKKYFDVYSNVWYNIRRSIFLRGLIPMRMRKKPNLEPRMAACADWLITKPEELAGRWREAFPGYDALWIELGCGKGRFTAETAKTEPNTLLIAVERVPDAMVVAMERAKAENIENVRFIDIDAARLTEIFAAGEADGIDVNFPDPGKKSRQAKRRLTAPAFLKLYETVLRPDGEIRFKTDNRPLYLWSVQSFSQNGWGLYEVTTDLHADGVCGIMTDYERKFVDLGVQINRLVAKKNHTITEASE